MKNDYIKEKEIYFRQNIDDYKIDEEVVDKDGDVAIIKDKSKNSILVHIKRKTKKGVDCLQWFSMTGNKAFGKIFQKINKK